MKSGFVMLAGRSNVGKSTLLNAMVGTKVSIVTPKPQTTRHPMRGILHNPRGQLVFVDTPGIFLGRKDPVSKRLTELVHETLEGVDAILYVVDPTRAPGKEEEYVQTLLKKAKSIPIFLLINKSDLRRDQQPFLDYCEHIDVGQRGTIKVSAKKEKNLDEVIGSLLDVVPDGEPHYPDLQLTDTGHNQWLEELIREKIFLSLEEELPYSIKVVLEQAETRENGSRYLEVTIWTTEERYKRMIIGAKGQMIRTIGQAARLELEAVTGTKIFLDLDVKVDPKWQERFH